jgi:hypothetical protein
MSIKIEGDSIADISYVPPILFDKIPTIISNDILCISPNMQRIDMHSVLSTPFGGFPRCDFFNRAAKVIKRFNLLDKYYPIEYKEKTDKNMISYKISKKYINNLHHGIVAYSILCQTAKTLLGSDMPSVIESTIKVDQNGIDIDIDLQAPLLISFVGIPSMKLGKTFDVYNPALHIRSKMYIAKEEPFIIFVDERRRIISCETTIGGLSLKHSHAQYLLNYFISEYWLTGNDGYLLYYKSIIDMIDALEKKGIFDEAFFMTTHEDKDVHLLNETSEVKIEESKKNIGLQIDNEELLDPIPQGFRFTEKWDAEKYPIKKFDYSTSSFFQLDGQLIK